MIPLRFVTLEKWPGEATRPGQREHARFRATYGQTLKLLESELTKLGARGIIVQAFFQPERIRNDGWPYAAAKPSAPGIILSFVTWKDPKTPLSFPCDRYITLDDNLRAIALSLQALRAVDRYGVTRRSEQYAGWKEIAAPLPGGFADKEAAANFIIAQVEVPESANATKAYQVIADVALRQELYRRAARRLHPDAPTGNHELFVRLQQANTILEAR